MGIFSPPRGENIPTSVTPAHIYYSVPMEEEVEWAARRIWGHRSGGISQMRVKHLQEWLRGHRLAEAVAEEQGTDEEGEEGSEKEN